MYLFNNDYNYYNYSYYSYFHICLTILLFILFNKVIHLIKNKFFDPPVYVFCNEQKNDFKLDKNNAGIDLKLAETIVISAGECAKVFTTVAVNLPSGYHGILKERSSIGYSGISLLGGVIDSGYTEFISLILVNTSRYDRTFKAGERVAQIIIQKNEDFNIKFVNNQKDLPYKMRGKKGFGSTNIKQQQVDIVDQDETKNNFLTTKIGSYNFKNE